MTSLLAYTCACLIPISPSASQLAVGFDNCILAFLLVSLTDLVLLNMCDGCAAACLNGVQDNLVNSFHLLICVVETMYLSAQQANRTDLISASFTKAVDGKQCVSNANYD